MRVKKELSTGSILELDYCNFNVALNLLQKIAKILNNENFKFDSDFLKNIENNDFLNENFLNNILKSLLTAITDNNLIDVIIEAGNQSLINGERITKEYFEEVENTKDFFIVLFEIAKYNLSRFLAKAPIISKEEAK